MNKSQNVALKINESALIKNLKFSFSNMFTVVSELLQNGRRAGATSINIVTEEIDGSFVMTVIDNGSGLDDFQSLLTVAESGWDEKTIKDERAFGMGFLSALFSARRVVVQSNGRTLDLDTEHLLSMNDVTVLPVASFTGPGTSVSLHGIKPEVVNNIESLVDGFPIPVFFNGVEIERKHALDQGAWLDTTMGKMRVDFHELCHGSYKYHYEFSLYLQGFKVWSSHSSTCCDPSVVMHLDSKSYFGRLPDRDKLIDQDIATKNFNKTLAALTEAWLISRLSEIGDLEFCNLYGRYVVCNMPHLMMYIKTMLPVQMTEEIENLSLNSDRHQQRQVDEPVTLTQLESGEVLLFEDRDNYEECGEELVWQFIQHHDNAMILSKPLPKGHWAKKFVLDPKKEAFKFEVIGEGRSGVYSGEYITTAITLCEQVNIKFKKHVVEVKSFSVYIPDHGILVPKNETPYDAGNVVEVISGFYNDDFFNESSYETDKAGVNRVVRNLHASDFSEAINDAITSQEVERLDGIEGKCYLVRFGQTIETSWDKKGNNVGVVEFGELFKKLGLEVSDDDIRNAMTSILVEKNQEQH